MKYAHLNARKKLRVAKFFRFKNSANLQKVRHTSSFCVLFFLTATLVLNKFNFKKVREVPHSFEDCLEIDACLVFFSKQSNSIVRYSMQTSEKQPYLLPLEHHLLHVEGCPKGKFLVATTQNRKIGSYSIVFWAWNSSKFLYIFDESVQPEGIQVLDSQRLVVFGKNRFKVFDTKTVQCVQNVKVDGFVQQVHLVRDSLLLLVFQDESYFTIDLDTRETMQVSHAGSTKILVFLKDLRLLLDSTDIRNITKIDL